MVTLTPIEYVLAGMWILQTVSAAVSAMPKPHKEGWYSWFYKFTHQLTNNLDQWFEQKYDMAMPRVTDESATQTITTPDSKTETSVSKVTTTAPTITPVIVANTAQSTR